MAKTIQIALVTTLDAKGARELDQWLAKLSQAGAKATPKGGGGDPFASASAGAQKATSSVVALQRAQAGLDAQAARLARSQGDVAQATQLEAQAQQRLQNTLAQQNSTTTATIAVQRQLLTIQQQSATAAARAAQEQARVDAAYAKTTAAIERHTAAIARASQETLPATRNTQALGASVGQVQGALGALGIVATAAGVVQFGSAALSAANNLERTKATVLALSGSQSRYNEVLATARAGQALYGGSLAENIGGLGSLVNLSNKAGVSLSQLDNIARRLAVVDPLQGIEGANAALKEFASGNIGTLATRFELPRDALRKLNDESLTMQQRFNALDAALTDMGISSQVLSNATQTNAAAFTQLGSAALNATDQAGALLQTLLKFPAQVTTKLLVSISENAERVASIDEQVRHAGETALAVSDDFETYSQKIGFVNNELQALGTHSAVLSHAQFEYAKSLMASGASAEEARTKVLQYGAVIQAVSASNGDWMQSNTEVQNQLVAIAAGGDGYAAAIQNLSNARMNDQISAETYTTAIAQVVVAHDQAAAAAAYDSLEQNRLTMMHYDGAAAAQEAAAAAAIDTMEKERDTLQTQLLAEQTQIATDAFLAANPAINASGIQAAVTAGAISPLIGRLAELTLQIRQAKAELGGMAMGRPETGGDALTRNLNNATASQKFLTVQTERATAAQRQQVLATGNAAQKANILKENYDAAVRSFGRGSAEAISAQTKLIQAQQSAAKGGGGGAGGRAGGGSADKAAKAAEATGTRLADIARQGGNKLADIEEATQSKLAAIDQKYAEQRAESQRALFNEIARMSAGEAYSQQLNDFEQFSSDMSDEQKALFAAREASEVRYNERIAAAQEDAKAEALNGDADLAEDKLKIRTDEAKRQMEIEQAAAKASIDSEGKNAAAIAQTAQEASAASKAQADTDIAIVEAKAAEKAGAMQAEKDAVIAAAEEQKNKVIEAATEQAAKVKGASDDQKSTVISNLRAQADAAGAWADAISSAAGQAQQAMDGVTGPPAAVGGEGEGGAPASEDGSEPGGQGMRASGQGLGRGASGGGGGGSMTDAIQTLNDAAEILKILKPFVASNKGAVKLLNEYKLVVQSAVGSLLAIQDLRERLVQPQPVLDLAVVARLKQDVEAVVAMMFNIDASMTSKVRVLTKYLELETASIEILNGVIDLRGNLSKPTPPIDLAYVARLHQESQAVVQTLLGQMMPVNQQQLTLLQRYATAQGQSVQILTDVADLRERLSGDIGGPFDMAQIAQFAKRAAEFVRLIDQQIVPLTEEQAVGFSAYADAAGAAVQILIDVADLRERLSGDIGGPFNPAQIQKFAERAAEFTRLIQGQLVPTTEESASALSRYADSASAAIQILVDVADLRTRLSEDIGTPFDMRVIQRLATEAQQITRLVYAVLIPMTEEQADGFSHYADTVSSAVGIISDVAGLRKDAMDLAPPIPERAIVALATEAKRITQIVQGQLIPTTEETATGFSDYADTVSSAVGIISDVAGLRKDAMDLASPIPDQAIIRLADEAKRITAIVLSRMIPASEEQAEAAKRFADTTGSAVKALSDTLGFSGRLFADYVSPSDAQLNMVVADANRIVKRVDAAAKVYGTEGLAAAQAFGDATGSVLSAFKDQLLFSQAINSGDFGLNPTSLAAFETGMGQTLAVANRLGAQAAAIPAGNIAALQSAATALTASYDSMIKLAAVPAGNLPQLTAGLSAGVGGGPNIIVNINNPPANLNVAALQQQVMQGVSRALAGKH